MSELWFIWLYALMNPTNLSWAFTYLRTLITRNSFFIFISSTYDYAKNNLACQVLLFQRVAGSYAITMTQKSRLALRGKLATLYEKTPSELGVISILAIARTQGVFD